MEEREFWVQFRRWLKGRISGDQQMVAAIERRFDIGDNVGADTRRTKPAA